jgi:ABC-2 type transport system permease protein
MGPLCSGYLGVVALGGMGVSVGLLCSALTRNQIVAAISSFVIVTMLWTVGIFKTFVAGTTAQGFFSYVSILDHFFDSFSKGIVDTRPLVYYLSSTVLCLFLTVKVVESRKWR